MAGAGSSSSAPGEGRFTGSPSPLRSKVLSTLMSVIHEVCHIASQAPAGPMSLPPCSVGFELWTLSIFKSCGWLVVFVSLGRRQQIIFNRWLAKFIVVSFSKFPFCFDTGQTNSPFVNGRNVTNFCLCFKRKAHASLDISVAHLIPHNQPRNL